VHRLIGRPGGASRASAGQDAVGHVGQDQGIDAELPGEAIHLALDGIETAGHRTVARERLAQRAVLGERRQLDQGFLLAVQIEVRERALGNVEALAGRARDAVASVHRQHDEHSHQHQANGGGGRHQRAHDQFRRTARKQPHFVSRRAKTLPRPSTYRQQPGGP
jgi:hypothetical protein